MHEACDIMNKPREIYNDVWGQWRKEKGNMLIKEVELCNKKKGSRVSTTLFTY